MQFQCTPHWVCFHKCPQRILHYKYNSHCNYTLHSLMKRARDIYSTVNCFVILAATIELAPRSIIIWDCKALYSWCYQKSFMSYNVMYLAACALHGTAEWWLIYKEQDQCAVVARCGIYIPATYIGLTFLLTTAEMPSGVYTTLKISACACFIKYEGSKDLHKL